MMKKLIITGGAGFIGSNAVDYFIKKKDYQVTAVIDKLTYASDLKRIENYPNLRIYKFDIADANLQFMFEKEKPDVIINFAAESHVDKSISAYHTDDFIKSNYIGAVRLVHAIRSHRSKTNKNIFFVHISTDEVLGDLPLDSDIAYDEYKPLKPNNLYAATKAAAEQIIQAEYHTHKDFDYTILRSTNNYGPNQHFEKFIPTVIRSLLENKKIPLYGKGDNIREWLWTRDFIVGIDKVIQEYYEKPSDIAGEIFHFGSAYRVSNLEIVRKILEAMGKSEDMIEFVEDRPGHDRKYALSHTKANIRLNWQAEMAIDIGLRIVITDIENRMARRKDDSLRKEEKNAQNTPAQRV
jgi:dTDP-glucose 4,6-dehydratase